MFSFYKHNLNKDKLHNKRNLCVCFGRKYKEECRLSDFTAVAENTKKSRSFRHLAPPPQSKIGVTTGFCRFENHGVQQFYGFGAYKCTLQYYMVGLRVAEVNIPPLWGRTKEGDGFFNLKYKSQATLNCPSPTLTLPRGEGTVCKLAAILNGERRLS